MRSIESPPRVPASPSALPHLDLRRRPEQRSVVFAFLCWDQPPTGEKSGIETLLTGLRASGRKVHGVIDVRVGGVPAVTPESPPRMVIIRGWSETMNEPWADAVWEALSARQPPMAALSRGSGGKINQLRVDASLLSRQAWWRQGAVAPLMVLVLHPAAPDDADSVLALARSLEGMVQALANQ